ncbi:hypothetical protein BX666DRAFT_2023206 [Dichotomocladium elegans]|nr:hypothetical protein BX666DRAFT_2023206 [Dichotomocladium elegans]
MSLPVVIVTGASRGIGKAAALDALYARGARVVAVARNVELLNKLQEEVAAEGKQDNLLLVEGDVTVEETADRVVEKTIQKWGKIDAVIANAGAIEPIAPIAVGSIEEWKRLFDINLFSVLMLVQKTLPYLRKSNGSIVMVSSGAAVRGYRGWAAYGATKAALNHLTSSLAVEEPQVTSIAIRPGVVDTDMQVLIRSTGKESMDKDYQKFVDLHESGALVPPEKPGRVLAGLAVKAARELSGSFLRWDADELKEYQ